MLNKIINPLDHKPPNLKELLVPSNPYKERVVNEDSVGCFKYGVKSPPKFMFVFSTSMFAFSTSMFAFSTPFFAFSTSMFAFSTSTFVYFHIY
jgi:hypothetical protein